MAFTFSLSSVPASSSSSTAFSHGDSYPAIIAGLWGAKTSYQGVEKHGVYVLFVIRDDNDKTALRGMFINLDGYVLGARAAYAKMMCGLLRTSADGEELRQKIEAGGYSDLSSIVGLPCLARMAIRERGDSSWAYIDGVAGETAKSKGLHDLDVSSIPAVDIQKVAGKFVEIPSTQDRVVVPGLQVLEDDAESVYKDNVEDSLF